MGGKTSTTTSQVKIPQEVLDRYNAVNLNAEAVAKNPFQKYGTTAEDFVAPINEQQLSGISNVNAAAGSYQPFLAGATGATVSGMDPAYAGIDNYMSPYVKNVADTTGAMMRQQFEQAQSGNLGTAASSGAFGGDRAGIAAANLQQQNQMAYGKTMADVMNQGYTQALGASQADLSRLLQGGQQLANLGQMAQGLGLQGAEAQINAGTLQQQTDQAGKTALVNQFMQEQGYPFQVAQFLANIAMGTGALSGSTTTTTQPGSFFSDRRLKEDIKRIGKTDDGMPIYSFKYRGDDAEQTHIGFMADEVEKVKPEAVGLHPSGYKTVDYAKATENSMGGGVKPGHAGQGFADGGVAGPYGASPGSQVNFGGYVPQAFLPVGELIVADPAIADASRQSMAQQLASIANLGENVKSLDETWQWAKDKWGSDPKADAVSEGEAARGVTKASGGAAYLKSEPSGGLVPNSAKSYLSDTLEGQNEDAKERSIMQPGSAPGQQASGASQLGSLLGGAGAAMSGFASIAPLLGISDRRAKHEIRRIGKTDDGMPIYKFKYKGDDREQTHVGFMADEVERKHPDAVSTGPDGMKRVDYSQADKFYQGGIVRSGYQVGGRPEEETVGEKISRLTAPARYAVTDSLPNAAMAVGSLPIAGLQGAAGLALGAVNQPEASSYMLDAARNSLRRSARFDRAANAPMPENLSSEEIRGLNAPLSPEQVAAREAMSNMTMEPSRSNGVLPSEYGRLLMNPAGSLPVGVADPMRFAVGDARMGAEASPMRSAVGDARMGAEANPMRFAAGDSRMNPGLAPASSIRPQARPEGLGAASTSTAAQPDVPSSGMKPVAGTSMADTGNAPAGGYTPIVPLKTQLDFVMHELAMPEYNRFMRADYSTAGQAAIGFENIYERAGGAGNDRAAAYAEDVYAAAQNGDLSSLPPNAAATYEHFINAGMDPIKAAGATGRLMVESYAHVDPNARNTLGGGNGTYGVAQWRGPRMEALAEFAGVPMDAITSAPVSTPEGRYYSTGDGLGGAGSAPLADRRGLGAGILTSDKPYEDRTTLGKMFYNEDGTVNRNALLSLTSGLGAMLSSPSQFFLPSLGLGLQGAASTYAGLEKQAADIGLTKAEERRVQIEADKGRFIEFSGGRILVNFGDGRPAVTLQDYLRNPAAYGTGDAAKDQAILEAAREAAATSGVPVGGAPEGPSGVRFTAPSQDIINQQNAYVSSDVGFGMYGQNVERAAVAVQEASDLGASAMNGKASSNELAKTVAGAIAAGDFGSVEGQRGVLNSVLQPLNAVLTSAGIEAITPINETITSQQILDKLGVLRAGAMTPEQQRAASVFERFVETNPTLEMTKEAAAEITAALQMSHQMDIDRAQYFNYMQSQLPAGYNPYALSEGFNREYGSVLQEEKSQLSALYKMADDPTPLNGGRTRGELVTQFMKDVNAGLLDQATAQEILSGLLAQQNINASPILARWFIRGM